MREWLHFSNLHVIPVAAGFVLGTYALSGVRADPAYVVLAACGAFLVYQWDRASGLSPEDEINIPERRQWLLERPVYLAASSVVAAAGVVWAVAVSSAFVRYAGAVLGIVGVVYAVPILIGRRPKELPGVKNTLIALCWVAGASVVPLMDADAAAGAILWLAAHRMLYIIPNLFVADLVDRRGDRATGVGLLGRRQISGTAAQTGSAVRKRAASVGPVGVAGAALVLSVLLAGIALYTLAPAGGSAPVVLTAVDLLGMAGTLYTIRRADPPNHADVVRLDAWVAFPIVTWVVSLVI